MEASSCGDEHTAQMPDHQTTLNCLPQEVVGEIYARLRNPTDRRHFFQSCRAVHDAESVLRQIDRLELRTQDLSELTRFPKNAVLRVLKVNKRTNLPIDPFSRQEQPCGDMQGPLLSDLWAFAATDKRASTLLQAISELHLHGYNIQTLEESAPIPMCCPNLQTLMMSNIRIRNAQIFEQLMGNCSKLRGVDVTAADRASLDAILDGLAALRHALLSLHVGGVNNTLHLNKLAFSWSCLEVLDLSWHNDVVFGMPEFLSACNTLKVLQLGVHTAGVHVTGSASLQHVEFACVHLRTAFPQVDLASCPALHTLTVHELSYCAPEDVPDEVFEQAQLEERLSTMAAWPIQWGGEGCHLIISEPSAMRSPRRGGEEGLSFGTALSSALAGSPPAARVSSLEVSRRDPGLAHLSTAFPHTTFLDVSQVLPRSSLVIDAARCWPRLVKMRMAIPTTLSTSTYRISDARDSRIDYVGMAQAVCALSFVRAADLPLMVELVPPFVQCLPQWDDAKWDGVLRVSVAQRGKPGAVVKQLCADDH